MSLGIGSLKYEIDKITRLTSSTKRLPLFAYLWSALVNEAAGTIEGDRVKTLENIRNFCGTETVQTLFIIIYPLYKNICLLTGRNPKDVAFLLAKAIVTISEEGETIASTADLKLVNDGEKVKRRALRFILQGRTTTDRPAPILPDISTFMSMINEFPELRPDADEPTSVFAAALAIVELAEFLNLSALGKFKSSDDESRAANTVLINMIKVFGDNPIYDQENFKVNRKDAVKARTGGRA